MKKVNFTLGLMIAMLFMATNAYSANITHTIGVTFSAQASELYGGSGVTFNKLAIHPNGSRVNISTTSWSPAMLLDGEEDTESWSYGGTSISSSLASASSLYDFQHWSLKAINNFKVQVKYRNGNEVTPVLKRTITLSSVNNATLNDEGIIITHYFNADSSDYRPYMDRKTDVATYVFNDQMLPLIYKYLVYSIDYELTLNDEVGTPGVGDNQLPVFTDTEVYYNIGIEAQKGISTSLNTATAIFASAYSEFKFTVFSSKPIEITSSDSRYNKKGGIKIDNKENGSYDVTVAPLMGVMTLTISSVTTESDEVSNGFIAGADAVWAAGGMLYVKSAEQGTLSVYSITGQLNKQIPVSGSYSLALAKGIYIVKLNGKAYKVVL